MDINLIKEHITDLISPDSSEFIKNYTNELLTMNDSGSAKEFFDFLTEKLNEQGSKISTTNPTLYDQYEKHWIHLAFKVFSTLETSDQENLIQQRLLFAVQQGYELDNLYKGIFEWMGRLPETQAFVKGYVKLLEQNSETLGSAPIEVEGRKVTPQVKNWVLDYSKFPSASAKRGSIERLNYVNKSGNTRGLTQVQKQNLLSILKFYDDVISADIPPKQKIATYSPRPQPVQRQTEPPRFTPPQTHVKYAPPQGIDIQQKLNDLRQRTNR